MADTPLKKIDRLLEEAIDDTERSDVRYNIRSARQLIKVVENRNLDIDDVADDEQFIEETEPQSSLD